MIFPRFKIPTGDPPLGLAYLASYLREKCGSNVSIFDSGLHPGLKRAADFIEAGNPEIVGIFFDTMMYNDAIEVARIARKPGRLVVAGGPHTSVLPGTVVNHVDVVVIGEGEKTLSEIIGNGKIRIDNSFRNISGIYFKLGDETVLTREREPITDLDSLPFPAFDLLEVESYVKRWHYLDCVSMKLKGTNLITSRGCPFSCTYCQPTLRKMFGPRVCSHSPGYVVDGIKYLKDKFRLDAVFFHDDTITADKKWIDEFCRLMISNDAGVVWGCNTRADIGDYEMFKVMYAAGCRKFHIGAESASPRILNEVYRKGVAPEDVWKTVELARKAGIKCFCFFMLGAPGETYEEMRGTGRFACRLSVDEVSFSLTTPLPGTYLYDMVKSDKKYTLSPNFSKYNYYSKRAFSEPGVSEKRIKFYQIFYLLRFYANPKRWSYLTAHFKSFAGLKKLLRKILRSLK